MCVPCHFNFFFGNIFGEIENAHSLVFTVIFNAKNAVKAKKKTRINESYSKHAISERTRVE